MINDSSPPNFSKDEETYNNIEFPPLENYNVPKNSFIGKVLQDLKCINLSEASCNKVSKCKYNNTRKICEPSNSISKSSFSSSTSSSSSSSKDEVKTKGETNDDTYEEYLFGTRRLWRIGISDLISTSKCSFQDYIKNINIFSSSDKSSKSDSIIMSGLINPSATDRIFSLGGSNIIIKTTFHVRNSYNNSLVVENAIYENIITRFVNENYSPNVMSYLGTTNCNSSEISKSLHRTELEKYNQEIDKIEETEELEVEDDDDDNDYPKYDISKNSTNIFLEKASGQTLTNWVNSTLSEPDILAVCFQITYTLMCFGNIGLRHNDLHPGNIFIEDMGRPITLYFNKSRENNEYIELTTRYIPKIYDFDRGSIIHPAVPRNITLDIEYCSDFGTCNYFNNKYDMFTFINILHTYMLSKMDKTIALNILQNWIVQTFDKKWYVKTTYGVEYAHLLRKLTPPTDDQFKSPKDILSLLINYKWAESPFKVIKGDINLLPKDIVFSPPTPMKLKVSMIPLISHHSYINYSLEELSEETDISAVAAKLLELWDVECDKYKYYPNSKYNEILIIVKNKCTKMSPEEVGSYYSGAITFLCYPMFHKLDIETQKSIATEPIFKAISNLWNMFNNEIPVEILNISLIEID
jgi:hypothetical protein